MQTIRLSALGVLLAGAVLCSAAPAASLQGLGGLGVLPCPNQDPIGIKTEANGVSADSTTVVGWSSKCSLVHNNAFRWQGGTMIDMGASLNHSVAHATSADGALVVGKNDFGSTNEAFLWQEPQQPLCQDCTGTLISLGTLPGGAGSTAFDLTVRPSGDVVVVGRSHSSWSSGIPVGRRNLGTRSGGRGNVRPGNARSEWHFQPGKGRQ